uniref:Programmed cell death protein 2 C-terminal domain-containing protein n=1 Tax=Eucampia antarctica TaxID=49252 RepID=A0A7S2SKQ6_9STRA
MPPPCQYCGAERKFEFQILPQMLHFLLLQSNQTNNDNNNNDDNDDDSEDKKNRKNQGITAEQKQALMAASDIIERAEQQQKSGDNDQTVLSPVVPSQLRERHNQVLEQYKQGLGLKTDGKNNEQERLDWGTIVVYTCTASCSGDSVKNTIVNPDEIDHKLSSNSSYRLEYAWRQPGLD